MLLKGKLRQNLLRGDKMNKEGFTITINNDTKLSAGIKELEAKYLEYAYARCKYNQTRCARELGMSRGTFRSKLKQHFGDRYL